MVGFYASNKDLVQAFLNMPIMKPGHTWSSKIMEAMVLYIQFHLYGITQSQLRGQPGPWTDFAAALQSFMSTLKGGVKKKYTEEKQVRISVKGRMDLRSIKNLPSIPVMKKAVFEAFKDIAALCRTCYV
eukprot:4103129-Amphidinium_carterae.1